MNFKGYLVAVILVLFTSFGVAQGQLELTAYQDDKIVTSTNLVTVNVVVTDQKGGYVRGLTSKNFHVYDEGSKQVINHFSSEPAPISIGLVCEVHSGSLQKTGAMLAALRRFTRTLRSEDEFFVLAFGKEGSVETDFVPTPEQILDHLTAVRPGGPSSLYDAIYTASDRLRSKSNLKKALLIVSDGEDNNSKTTYDRLRNRLREFDVQIYAIGISNPETNSIAEARRWGFEDVTRNIGWRPYRLNADTSMGRAVLAEMARVSGGATYFPEVENEPELEGVFTQVALELRHQYTVGFYPNGVTSKRQWHRLRVTLDTAKKSQRLSLSYRNSYLPQPSPRRGA